MGARLGTGAAAGKVILFGEHAVVYGQPAVAAAMSTGLGATVEADPDGPILDIPGWGRDGMVLRLGESTPFETIARGFQAALDAAPGEAHRVRITLEGELPLGVGLGSSAAFAVSLLRALADYVGHALSKAELMAGAAKVEGVFHGTPSGLDHTVITEGGCLRYCRLESPPFRPVKLARPLPAVLAWTPREGSTRQAVEGLRARHDALPDQYRHLFAAMGDVAESGVAALEAGDLDTVGRLFDLAHGYLNACGVSSLANERMVHVARAHGATGAKLTGAGNGGAIVALTPNDAGAVVSALRAEGYRALATRIGG